MQRPVFTKVVNFRGSRLLDRFASARQLPSSVRSTYLAQTIVPVACCSLEEVVSRHGAGGHGQAGNKKSCPARHNYGNERKSRVQRESKGRATTTKPLMKSNHTESGAKMRGASKRRTRRAESFAFYIRAHEAPHFPKLEVKSHCRQRMYATVDAVVSRARSRLVDPRL